MSAIAVAVIGGAVIGGIFSSEAAGDASDASNEAAGTQAASEREALNYMKKREAIPQQFREGALKGLGGVYGLEGGTGSQQDLIDKAISSPLYGSIMGGQKAGEEAILRTASATGGFRSGNTQSNLYDYNVQLQNKALLESYNQQLEGLQGMAGLPSNTNAIAQQTGQIGQTLAQGQIGAAQAQQAGTQQTINNTMGMTQLGLMAYNYSDRRLKKNIEKIGEVNGHNWYMWDWNVVANKMGLDGKSEGVLADELVKTNPECIGIKNGFMIVDYFKLGIFQRGGTA